MKALSAGSSVESMVTTLAGSETPVQGNKTECDLKPNCMLST